MKQENATEAEPHARSAVELSPSDAAGRLGLAQTLLALDRGSEADEQLIKAIELDPHGGVGEAAKAARSRLAQDSFRSKLPGGVRPDAVMYLVGAMERFDTLDTAGVQRIGFEIAVLGMRGLDTDDPTQKYSLKSMPGEFSGLHLMCLMYAAFKRFAPEQDLGFDLSREYETALGMHTGKRQK